MKESYLIYKFFNSEASNPYDHEKQNAAHMFWEYERSFEELFTSPDFLSAGWHRAEGSGPGALEWKRIIAKKPIDKAEFFKLWLFELLTVHLVDKYMSSDSHFIHLYWATT
jgi:hypothetical protein